jgi:hypothetical protein
MSKNANQSSNWNFKVAQIQLRHPVTNHPIPQYGNFREDTGECLGVTSEKYGLLQNTELLDAAHAALEVKGLTDYKESIIVTGGGTKFFARFSFANKQLASRVGDVFGYQLTLKNSFDRTIRAAFSLGFLRLTCMNGASTLEQEFGVTQKHNSKITVDFLGAAIDKALAHGQDALRIYDQMADVPITDEQGVNILNQFVAGDELSGSLRESVKTNWLVPRRQEDKPRNLYNLYNALTEHLTHQVARERFEYADKVSARVLLKLVNAARNPAKLASLIVPVADGSQVIVNPSAIAGAADVNVIDVETVPA